MAENETKGRGVLNSLRRAAFTVSGIGFGRELAELADMASGVIPLPELDPKASIADFSHGRDIAAEIVKRRTPTAEERLALAETSSTASRTFSKHISSQTERWKAIYDLPIRKGTSVGDRERAMLRLVHDHLQKLIRAWNTFDEAVGFGIENPKLPDIERVRFVDQFALVAAEQQWPCHVEMGIVAGCLAKQYLDNTPKPGEGSLALLKDIPSAVRKNVADIERDPRGTADELLAKVRAIAARRSKSYEDLYRFVRFCRDNERADVHGDFATLLRNALSENLARIMDRIPREEHDKLAGPAKELEIGIDAAVLAHKSDIDTFQSADFSEGHEDTVTAAINAGMQIYARNPNDLLGSAQVFLSAFETWRKDRSEIDGANVEAKAGYDQLLPKAPDVEMTVNVPSYVDQLSQETSVSAVSDGMSSPPSARHGRDSLRPLAANNVYDTRCAQLMSDIAERDYPKKSSTTEMQNELFQRVRRRSDLQTVKERSVEFNAVRTSLLSSLEKMFDRPHEATAADVSNAVIRTEQIRTMSVDMFKSAGHAFAEAWMQFPHEDVDRIMEELGGTLDLSVSSNAVAKEEPTRATSRYERYAAKALEAAAKPQSTSKGMSMSR